LFPDSSVLLLRTTGIANTVPLKDSRDPHLKNIQPLRDADSVNNQPGGAYLMRSAAPEEVPTRLAAEGKVELKVVRGKGSTEVHQQFGDYASQIVRVREGSAAVELGKFHLYLFLLYKLVYLCLSLTLKSPLDASAYF